jgi:hypothetical protein
MLYYPVSIEAMANALGMASVTAALKSLLENGLLQRGIAASVGDVTVSALPPDRITTGADERSQLNLFLYRVTPNTGWRRSVLAPGNGKDAPEGQERASESERGASSLVLSLSLDLHYLLTAYGEQDFHAEILLGCAMQLLHETPLLARDHIHNALAAPSGSGAPLSPVRSALAASRLAEQVKEFRITAESTNTEELSRLWSALQARYRPSAAYKVSAVLLHAAPDGAMGAIDAMGTAGAPATPSPRRAGARREGEAATWTP